MSRHPLFLSALVALGMATTTQAATGRVYQRHEFGRVGEVKWIEGRPSGTHRGRPLLYRAGDQVQVGDVMRTPGEDDGLHVYVAGGARFTVGEGSVHYDERSSDEAAVLRIEEGGVLVQGAERLPVIVDVVGPSGTLAFVKAWGYTFVVHGARLGGTMVVCYSGRAEVHLAQQRLENLGPKQELVMDRDGEARRTQPDQETLQMIYALTLEPAARERYLAGGDATGGGSGPRFPGGSRSGPSFPGGSGSPGLPGVGGADERIAAGRAPAADPGTVYFQQVLTKFDPKSRPKEFRADEKGGVIQFAQPYPNGCQGHYQFRWQFSRPLVALRPGETFDVAVSCPACQDSCGYKWTGGRAHAAGNSASIGQLGGYQYNGNIENAPGSRDPGGVVLWGGPTSKTYSFRYRRKKDVRMTELSLKLGKHDVTYVFSR